MALAVYCYIFSLWIPMNERYNINHNLPVFIIEITIYISEYYFII